MQVTRCLTLAAHDTIKNVDDEAEQGGMKPLENSSFGIWATNPLPLEATTDDEGGKRLAIRPNCQLPPNASARGRMTTHTLKQPKRPQRPNIRDYALPDPPQPPPR